MDEETEARKVNELDESYILVAQLETESVFSHLPNPHFTVCTQRPFSLSEYNKNYS